MILLVNQEIISNVLDKLAVTYQIVGETEIKGIVGVLLKRVISIYKRKRLEVLQQ